MTPLGFMGVVGADVEVDINDPQRYTSWIGQSGLGLPDESYYREEAQAPCARPMWRTWPRCSSWQG